MNDIDFRTFNLNLVPALVALLRETSVGGAARATGVSQSAMSHSLAKLRELLDDPLLVQQGRRMVLTARARVLASQLPAVLQQLRTTLTGPEPFDPSVADLTFHIATVDYFEMTSLPTLIAYLATHAPGVRLCIERLSSDSRAALQSGRLDLILGSTGFGDGAGIQSLVLYRDPFKVIVRSDHPTIRRRPSMAAYLAAEHVVVRFEGRQPALVDRMLARAGTQRRVGLWVPHFASAPLTVASTDMISTVPSAVAARAREMLDIRVFEPPLALPPGPVTMWWPRAHEADSARTWLRDVIRRGTAAPPVIRKLMRAEAAVG